MIFMQRPPARAAVAFVACPSRGPWAGLRAASRALPANLSKARGVGYFFPKLRQGLLETIPCGLSKTFGRCYIRLARRIDPALAVSIDLTRGGAAR